VKGNESNFAFICFQQFFGNWTFQWVIADLNRKNRPPAQLALRVVQNASLRGMTPPVRIRSPADNNFLQQNKFFDNSVFVKIKHLASTDGNAPVSCNVDAEREG
jgi:hypothetical protein